MVDLSLGIGIFGIFIGACFHRHVLSFRVNGLAGIEEVRIVDASRYFSRIYRLSFLRLLVKINSEISIHYALLLNENIKKLQCGGRIFLTQ